MSRYWYSILKNFKHKWYDKIIFYIFPKIQNIGFASRQQFENNLSHLKQVIACTSKPERERCHMFHFKIKAKMTLLTDFNAN